MSSLIGPNGFDLENALGGGGSTYTSDNAITLTGTNFQLGGVLLNNTNTYVGSTPFPGRSSSYIKMQRYDGSNAVNTLTGAATTNSGSTVINDAKGDFYSDSSSSGNEQSNSSIYARTVQAANSAVSVIATGARAIGSTAAGAVKTEISFAQTQNDGTTTKAMTVLVPTIDAISYTGSKYMPLSVNNTFADAAGNITVAAGGSTTRFGIEDNTGVQARVINHGTFDFTQTYGDLTYANYNVRHTFGSNGFNAYANNDGDTVETNFHLYPNATNISHDDRVLNAQGALGTNTTEGTYLSSAYTNKAIFIAATKDNAVITFKNFTAGTTSKILFPVPTSNNIRTSVLSVNNTFADTAGNVTLSGLTMKGLGQFLTDATVTTTSTVNVLTIPANTFIENGSAIRCRYFVSTIFNAGQYYIYLNINGTDYNIYNTNNSSVQLAVDLEIKRISSTEIFFSIITSNNISNYQVTQFQNITSFNPALSFTIGTGFTIPAGGTATVKPQSYYLIPASLP